MGAIASHYAAETEAYQNQYKSCKESNSAYTNYYFANRNKSLAKIAGATTITALTGSAIIWGLKRILKKR